MSLSVMVPLDRSSFAEQALPLALSIARRANARLDLVEVHALCALEDPTAGRSPYEPEQDSVYRRQEQLYLDATAQWLTSVSPVLITANLLSGSTVLPRTVADSILERARTKGTDLIVMTTHGRGSSGRVGLGSVADELIRRSSIPILLVRPGEDGPRVISEPVLDNILIPLDGSELAEQILQPALDLARLMEARCCLLRVVESQGSNCSDGPDSRAYGTKAALAYLDRTAAKTKADKGVEVRTCVVVARNVAAAIVKEATKEHNSLLALATHGRSGLKRLVLGSVADQIVRAAAVPVLVYHPLKV